MVHDHVAAGIGGLLCLVSVVVSRRRAGWYPRLSGDSSTPGKTGFRSESSYFQPVDAGAEMQRQIDDVYRTQQHNEFGKERNALMFLPGAYKLDIPIGFYTEVLGLGASPDDVRIAGNVHSDAACRKTTQRLRSGEQPRDFDNTCRGHDAMGGIASRTVSTHARSRRYRAPSAQRVGERRLDVRRPD